MPYWGKKFETETEAEAELESLIMDYAQSKYPLKVYVPMNSQSNKKPEMQKYYIDKSEKTKFVKFLREMSEVYDKSDEDIIARIKEIYNERREDYGLLEGNNIYIFIYSVYSDIKNSLLSPTKKKKIFELIFTPLSKDTIYAELSKFGNGGEGGFKKMKRELSSPSSTQFERTMEFSDPRSPMPAEFSMGKKRKSTKTRGRKKKEKKKKSSSIKSNSNRNRNHFNSRLAYPQDESPTSLGNKKKQPKKSSRKRKSAKKKM